MKLPTKLAFHVHVECIKLKPDNLNVSSARTFLDELVSLLDLELAQHLIVKNVVQLVNTSTLTPVFADRVATDSSNPTKAHSIAKFAAWVKPQDQQKPNQDQSAEMNALQVCNLALMVNANHAQEVHIALKESNQHVTLVPWDVQHRKLAQQLLKNVHCQFAHQELISMLPSMFVLNVAKASTSPSHNRLRAFPAHQIIAPRTLPPLQRLNVLIHAKLPLKVTNTVMPMLIVYSFLKLLTSSVNANQDSMELELNAQVKKIISLIRFYFKF